MQAATAGAELVGALPGGAATEQRPQAGGDDHVVQGSERHRAGQRLSQGGAEQAARRRHPAQVRRPPLVRLTVGGEAVAVWRSRVHRTANLDRCFSVLTEYLSPAYTAAGRRDACATALLHHRSQVLKVPYEGADTADAFYLRCRRCGRQKEDADSGVAGDMAGGF